ncbi:MAG TPA: TIGR03009 domain-containing protein [Thermoguttaceae bacterium]|nr:TIGR03009 domain-containing protein [Thermoguttaceae bacterium]
MTLRIGLWTKIGLLLMVGPVWCQQTQPYQTPPPRQYAPVQPVRSTAGPNQPIGPRVPTLQHAPAVQQAPAAPFRLTPQQEADLDRMLTAWEQNNQKIRTFASDFTRWEYDPVFGDPNKPKSQSDGKLKYASPDKGMFHVESKPPEHWVCDGKSVFEFNGEKKQLIEHQLPPELQGKAIANGPLPFLFGAEAAKLKQRYFMRIVTPPEVQGKQIWLEAIPRYQQDAANFRMVELILNSQDMLPYGLQIYEPNGKNRTVYQFRDIVTNDPFGFLKGNPFQPFTPLGWKKIVEPAAQPRVTLQPGAGGAR